MRKLIEFKKFDNERRLVYAEVYKAGVPDSQGDLMFPEDVEAMAHGFNMRGIPDAMNINHGPVKAGRIVESYVEKSKDSLFALGSWVIGALADDDELWQAIKAKEINAFSMQGLSERVPVKLNGKVYKRLVNPVINFISWVAKGANGEQFKVIKSDNQNDVIQQIADSMNALNAAVVSLNKRIDAVSEPRDRTNLSKAVANALASDNAELRKAEAEEAMLQAEIESLWERPGPNAARTEQRLLDRLEDVQRTVATLRKSHNAPLLDDRSRSAFFARGGSSTFLVAGGAGTLRTLAGDSAQIRKAESEVEVENVMTLGIVK